MTGKPSQIFNFAAALPMRTSSLNTQRAYYRWIDMYLVDVADLKPTGGEMRLRRMEQLPLKTLQRHLTDRKLHRWLNTLAERGHGRQGLDQARAAVVTLAELMATNGVLENETAAKIRSVSVPSVAHNQPPERLLTAVEIRQLTHAAREMATSSNQMCRNQVVTAMLCNMVLRREELSAAKWGDIGIKDGKITLKIEDDLIEMPRPVLALVDRWRTAITGSAGEPAPHTPLIRRIWKGGRVAKDGLSPDGIWLIIRDAARFANMNHVTPDDLRRSSVAKLRDDGIAIEEISRLLRHRSLLITERFLAKLPPAGSLYKTEVVSTDENGDNAF